MRLVGKSLRSFNLPLPSRDDLVRAYRPEVGHKPDFLSSFPEEAREEILSSLDGILQKHSPSAARDREKTVVTVFLPDGINMPSICSDLVAECPFILLKYPKGPDETTIRHLMSAPALNRLTAKKYKGLVKAKLALGQNNKKEDIPLVLFNLQRHFMYLS